MTNQYRGEMCKELRASLDIISGKWKPSILFYLMNNGTMRFSELQSAMSEVTKKMLTSQLKELEQDNIVHREVYPEIPPKVEYSLTDYGQKLEPLLISLRSWGEEHIQNKEEQLDVTENLENAVTKI